MSTYKGSLDIIELNSLIFSSVLAGDFAPSRTGDKYIREMDSSGHFEDFENPDNSGTVTLKVRQDATNFLKELRRLMDSGEQFVLTRNNKNRGGEKSIYKSCLVMNDGSSGRGQNGVLARREWTISFESYTTIEGAN